MGEIRQSEPAAAARACSRTLEAGRQRVSYSAGRGEEPWPFFMPLFTQVRGRGILRTSSVLYGVLGSKCGLARGLQTASLRETSPQDYAAASKKLDCSGDRGFEACSRWRWALKGWVEPVAQPATTTGNVVAGFALGKGGVRTVRSLRKRLTRVANQGK
jgi:hypothetical protein